MTEQQTKHQFLFTPSHWLGQGTVAFNTSQETIKFHTSWDVSEGDGGIFQCRHDVELTGVTEHVVNNLTISDITSSEFVVTLTNDMVQNIKGIGVIDGERLAWEFNSVGEFEGFEVYNLIEEDKYQFHAEYLSSNQFRTIIDGNIWKKKEQ